MMLKVARLHNLFNSGCANIAEVSEVIVNGRSIKPLNFDMNGKILRTCARNHEHREQETKQSLKVQPTA